jgi:hypothetical protein
LYHETVAEIVNHPIALEVSQLTDQTIRQWWSEEGVDELDKLLPGGVAVVELQLVEPHLGIVEEIEHCVCNLLFIRCATQAEEPLIAVETEHRIALIIEFQELHLVGGAAAVVAGVRLIVVSSRMMKWSPIAAVAQRVLDTGEGQL